MKYSVRGNLNMSDGALVVALLNTFTLWKLETKQSESKFRFEVWLNTIQEKTDLFDQMKMYVDSYGGLIDWHECTHDEDVSRPCVIAEIYTQGG